MADFVFCRTNKINNGRICLLVLSEVNNVTVWCLILLQKVNTNRNRYLPVLKKSWLWQNNKIRNDSVRCLPVQNEVGNGRLRCQNTMFPVNNTLCDVADNKRTWQMKITITAGVIRRRNRSNTMLTDLLRGWRRQNMIWLVINKDHDGRIR